MTEKQERLLNRRFHEAVSQQPEIENLRQVLLELGGIQLVAPPRHDPAVPLLIDAGFVMAGPVQCIDMEESRCHLNVAQVWAKRQQNIVGIGTGYALSEDGLWRQHSSQQPSPTSLLSSTRAVVRPMIASRCAEL